MDLEALAIGAVLSMAGLGLYRLVRLPDGGKAMTLPDVGMLLVAIGLGLYLLDGLAGCRRASSDLRGHRPDHRLPVRAAGAPRGRSACLGSCARRRSHLPVVRARTHRASGPPRYVQAWRPIPSRTGSSTHWRSWRSTHWACSSYTCWRKGAGAPVLQSRRPRSGDQPVVCVQHRRQFCDQHQLAGHMGASRR